MSSMDTPQPTGFSPDDQPLRVDDQQSPEQDPVKAGPRKYRVMPRESSNPGLDAPLVPLSPAMMEKIAAGHQAREQQFVNVMYTVTKNDADFEAKVRKLGVNLGGEFSKQSIRDNLPAFQRAWEMRKIENLDLKAKNPALYQDLTDLDFAQVAYDIVEPLSVWDKMWGDLRHDWLLNERNKLGSDFIGGVPGLDMVGDLKDLYGESYSVEGKTWAEVSKRIDELDEEMRKLPTMGNYFTPAFRFVGQQAETLASSVEETGAGALTGWKWGRMAGPASAVSAIAGASWGLKTGYAANSYKVNSGGAYIQMRRNGVSHQNAVKMAMASGVGATALEMLGAKAVGGSASLISPAKIKDAFARMRAKTGLHKVGWKTFAIDWAKRTGVGFIGETGTETAQTVVELMTGEVARRMELADIEAGITRPSGKLPTSTYYEGKALDEVMQTMAYTAQAMSVLGPFAGAIRAGARHAAAKKQVKVTQQFYNSMGDNDGLKTMAERAPDRAAAFIASRVKDSPFDHLQMDARDLRRVLGEVGMNDEQIVKLIPDAKRAFEMMTEHPDMKVDVSVESGKFIADVVTVDKVYKALAPIVRAEGDMMSLAELDASREALQKAEAELETAAKKADAQEEQGEVADVDDSADDLPDAVGTRPLHDQVRNVTQRVRGMLKSAGLFGDELKEQAVIQRAMLFRQYTLENAQVTEQDGSVVDMPFDEWFAQFGYEVLSENATVGAVSPAMERPLSVSIDDDDASPVRAIDIDTVEEADALIAKAEERQAAEQQEAEAAPEAETDTDAPGADAKQQQRAAPATQSPQQSEAAADIAALQARRQAILDAQPPGPTPEQQAARDNPPEWLAEFPELGALQDGTVSPQQFVKQVDARLQGQDVPWSKMGAAMPELRDGKQLRYTNKGKSRSYDEKRNQKLVRGQLLKQVKNYAEAAGLWTRPKKGKGGGRQATILTVLRKGGGLSEEQWRSVGIDFDALGKTLRRKGLVRKTASGPWSDVALELKNDGFLDAYLDTSDDEVGSGDHEEAFLRAVDDALAGVHVVGSAGKVSDSALDRMHEEWQRSQAADDSGDTQPSDEDLPLFQDDGSFEQGDYEFDESEYRPEVVAWAKEMFGGPPPAHRMQHRPPGPDTHGAPLHDLTASFPEDVYSENAQQFYGSAGDVLEGKLWKRLQSLRGKPDAQVTIYRAVPKSAAATEIGPGDWVSLDRAYAVIHGEGPMNGDYVIIEKEVKADEVFTSADSIQEAGYYPQHTPATARMAPNGKPVWQNAARKFNDSKVVDAQGKPTVVYHGTQRPDRIGGRFRKDRATSGPMSFFSDNPEVASNYATAKRDTSLEAPANYYEWFKVSIRGRKGDVDLRRAWNLITPQERRKVAALAPRVQQEDDPTKADPAVILGDESETRGLGGYDQNLREARGNHFLALSKEWLESGVLFGEEHQFLDVLRTAGFVGRVTLDDPNASNPGVVPVFLDIKNPLVTSGMSQDVVDALGAASKTQPAADPSGLGTDLWDKNTREPGDWFAELQRDISEGRNPLAWTSIPDWVTEILKEMGFDGIHDTGGKHGGVGHDVWIPFEANQIKSVNNKGDFSADERILYQHSTSLRKKTRTLKKYGLDPKKKYKTREVAAALEARTRAETGGIDRDDRSDEAVRKIAKWMVEEVLFEMDDIGASGVAWYSRRFQTALNRASKIYPELKKDKQARNTATLLIALTSDGTKPDENFNIAMGIYKGYRKNGKLRAIKGSARGATMAAHLRAVEKLFAKFGVADTHKYLMTEATGSELSKRAKALGVKFKTEYQVHIKMPMATVLLGPKLGAFYANLMGAHGYLTMDRWWSRTINRYRGLILANPTESSLENFRKLLRKPRLSDDETIAATVSYRADYEGRNFKTRLALLVGKSEPTKAADKAKWMATAKRKAGKRFTRMLNEHNKERTANTIYKQAFENLEDAPFNKTDRTFMLKAVNQAQKNLALRGHKMTIADIQAVLWYYEKKLYGELGATPSGKIAYDEAARLWVASETEGRDGQSVRERNAGNNGKAKRAARKRLGEEEYRPEGVDRPALYQDDGRPEQVAEGLPLFADGERGPFGSYRRTVDRETGRVRRVIRLMQANDPSTLCHESAHLFLDARIDLLRERLNNTTQKIVQPSLLRDMEAIFDLLEIGDPNDKMVDRIAVWDAMPWADVRVRHEEFAVGFESWMLLGEGPTKLESTWRRMAAWLKSIYGDATAINERFKAAENRARQLDAERTGTKAQPFDENLFELTPSVREIFLRLVAADEDVSEQIKASDQMMGLGFGDREDMDVREYAAGGVGAALVADAVRTGLINPGRIGSRIHKEARRVRGLIMREEQERARLEPVNRMRRFLATGTMIEESGDELGTPAKDHKLRTESVRGILPGDIKQFGAVTSPDGLDPREVAGMFGYTSITDMLLDLRNAPRIQEAVRERTQKRMSEEFGEFATPEAISRLIDSEMAGEAAQRNIIEQINAVLGEKGNSDVTLNAARDVAKRRIRRMRLRELRADKFEQSARRNRKLAKKRWSEGDTEGAAEAYRAELVDTATVRLVADRRVIMMNGERRQLDHFAKSKDRSRAKERDTRYLAVGRELLQRVGLLPTPSLPGEATEVLRRRDPEFYGAISVYLTPIEDFRDASGEPIANFRDITWEQFEQVMDIGDLLWSRSKSSRFGLLNKRKFDRDEKTAKLVDQLETVGRLKPYEAGPIKATIDEAMGILARSEHAMIQLDGGERGVWWRTIYKPIRDAFDNAEHDQREHLLKLREKMDEVNALPAAPREIYASKNDFNEFDHVFGIDADAGKSSIHELMAVLVNMGTVSNRDRTMLGRGWSTRIGDPEKGHADMAPMIRFLRRMVSEGVLQAEHFKLAQEILDIYEDILPSFQRATMEIQGIYAHELEAEPLTIRAKRGGEDVVMFMRGGYAPVRYTPDSKIKGKQEQKQAVETSGLFFGNGATKDRIEGYSDKVSLRLTDTMLAFQDHIRYAEVAPVAKQIRDLLDVGMTAETVDADGKPVPGESLAQILKRTNPGIYDPGSVHSVIYTLLQRATTGSLAAHVREPRNIGKMFRSLRNNYGSLTFSFDAKNASENMGALAQAAAMMGARWTRYGFSHQDADLAIFGPRDEAGDPVYAKNKYMANRLAKDAQQVIAQEIDPAQTRSELEESLAYVLPRWTQNIVDRSVWSGAYARWLALDRTAEQSDAEAHAAAQEYANHMVRILNSADIIDVGVYEGLMGEFGRNVTQWFSWANGQQQLTKTLWIKTMQEGGLGAYAGATKLSAALGARFLWRFLTHHYVMYMVGGAISAISRDLPDLDDDDDIERFMLDALLVQPLQFTVHATVPIAGDIALLAASTAAGEHAFLAGGSPAVDKFQSDVRDVVGLKAASVKAAANLLFLFRGFLPEGVRAPLMVAGFAGRQIDYASEYAAGNVEPTDAADAVRGVVTGKTSPASRRR